MKPSHLVLTATLAANIILVAVCVLRPTRAPAGIRGLIPHASVPAAAPVASTPPPPTAPPTLTWSAVANDDLSALVSRLRAAGFPARLIRSIVGTEINRRFAAQTRDLFSPLLDQPDWKTPTVRAFFFDPQFSPKYSELVRARSKLARELLGDDFFTELSSEELAQQQRRFGALSPAKLRQLGYIRQDYDEMARQLAASQQGITLPEDRAQLDLLNRERRADLAALLTPEELADYDRHTSRIAPEMRLQLTYMDATEAEFRTLYEIRAAFSDRISNQPALETIGRPGAYDRVYSPAAEAQREAAKQEMEAQIKAALGDDRYADYLRANNSDFQELSQLTERNHLPTATAKQAFAVWGYLAQESDRIASNDTLSVDQKRSALQALAQNSRAQYLTILGPTAGAAYLQSAGPWLDKIENGSTVSFTASGGMIFRRMPGLDSVTAKPSGP